MRAVETCLEAGAPGITVHPRADERHIRAGDVTEIAAFLKPGAREAGRLSSTSKAIRGDAFLELVLRTTPDQCTLVPVRPGEITSQAGWPPDDRSAFLGDVIRRLKAAGVRVSLFVDPDPAAVRLGGRAGRRPRRALHRAVRHGVRARFRRRRSELRDLRRGGGARARARPGRQRRARPRPRQPAALSNPAAPRRGVDRPRADHARAVGWPGQRGETTWRFSPSGRQLRRVRQVQGRN